MHNARCREQVQWTDSCCWSAAARMRHETIEGARQRSVDQRVKWRRLLGAQHLAVQWVHPPFLPPPPPAAAVAHCLLSPALRPMARNTPRYADIIDSALHCRPREVVNEEDSSDRDQTGVAQNYQEPVKGTSIFGECSRPHRMVSYTYVRVGRSTGVHNGRTGTGNESVRTPLFNRIHPLPPTPTIRRKMRKSHLVAILPFFASLASAQTFPNCTSGWDWVSHDKKIPRCPRICLSLLYSIDRLIKHSIPSPTTPSARILAMLLHIWRGLVLMAVRHHTTCYASPQSNDLLLFLSSARPHQFSPSLRYRKARSTVAPTPVRTTCACAIPSSTRL